MDLEANFPYHAEAAAVIKTRSLASERVETDKEQVRQRVRRGGE